MGALLEQAKRRERDSREWRAAGAPDPRAGDRHSRVAKDRQEATRQEARDRAEDQKVAASRDRDALPVDSATLARWCRVAALREGRRAGIDGSRDRRASGTTARLCEVDALASAIAFRVLAQESRQRPTDRPRAVLAWIDRAERMPTLAARDWRAGEVTRGKVGAQYLAAIARDLLANSREWRDTAETYRKRERSDRAKVAPMVVTTHDPTGPGWLAIAERRDREARGVEVAPIAADAQAVADATADLLGHQEPDLSAGELARVRAALAVDGGVTLASVAAREGWKVSTAGKNASEGRSILRTLDPADLLATIRRAAEGAGLTVRVRLDAPMLDAAERAAAGAVALAQAEGEQRAACYLAGQRGTYSPATIRATRREQRAAMRTGRYPSPVARRKVASGNVTVWRAR